MVELVGEETAQESFESDKRCAGLPSGGSVGRIVAHRTVRGREDGVAHWAILRDGI